MKAAGSMISVIVPVFNGAELLPEAIGSIRDQGHSRLEIIVVDDGSIDDTAAVARNLGDDVRYVYQENGGPAAARNHGIRLAHGEAIGFVDHDDLWAPGAIAALLPRLSSAEVAVGKSQILIRRDDDEKAGRDSAQEQEDAPERFVAFSRPWRSWHLSSALFDHQLFDRVGLFDESFQYLGDDLDWIVRLREAGARVAFVDQITHLYRIHDRNSTRGAEFRRLNLTEIAKKAIDRRRARSLFAEGSTLSELPEATHER